VSELFTPQRAALVIAFLSLLGFGAGAGVNQLVARWITLPESEGEEVAYVLVESPKDKAAGDKAAGDKPAGDNTEPDKGDGSAAENEAPAIPTMERPLASHRIPSVKEYSDIIVRRNIFDSTAVYVEQAPGTGNGECKSDSNLRLLATMVVVPPEYSTALLTEGARESKARPYRIGENLGSDGIIATIDQKKVCTESNICICMDQTVAKATAEPAAAAPSEGGIERLADNKFQVDRSVIDEAMGNVEALALQIKATPHKDASGNVDGFRLSAVRSTSLFGKLGIKNGDIIHSVNGTPLTSSEGAMAAYGALKSSSTFYFEITRRNQRMTMEYTIR
jgi:general secretion pathway protein C